MKERPILFSAPMVRAILAGTKTQTRRIVKPERVAQVLDFLGGATDDLDPPGIGLRWGQIDNEDGTHGPLEWLACCAEYPEEGFEGIGVGYGAVGDRLWVRETHGIYDAHGQHRADGQRWGPWGGLPMTVSPDRTQVCYYREGFDRCDPGRWRPSIHMPRWASRITLELTEVRVERLQDISVRDALAEGVNVHPDHHSKPRHSIYSPVQAYRELWEKLNGPDSWDANPWVWVLSFRRVGS